MGIPFWLLSLFLVFAHLLLQLYMLSVDTTGIKRSLSFCFLVTALIIIGGMSLFLVVYLLQQLRTSTIERPKIRESLTLGAFVAP